MSDKKNIDKIFRKKSLSFQKEPPPEIWDNILLGIQPAKKAVFPLFWRIAAGIAIILAFGLSYKYITKTEQLGDEYFSKKENSTQLIEESTELLEKESLIDKEPGEEAGILKKEEVNISLSSNQQNSADELPKSTQLSVLEYDKENDETFSWDKNNLIWSNTLNNMPIQINPSPAQKDHIPKKQFNIQHTWDDLLVEEDFEEIKEKDFLIEALLSPTYTYRDIGSSSSTVSDYYNSFESGQLSYSGGLKVGFLASDRLSIHAGLVYSRIGYSIGGQENIVLKSNAAFDQFASVENSESQPVVISNSTGKISTSAYSSSSVSTITTPENADASLDYLNSGALLSPDNRSVISDLSFSQIFHVMEIPLLIKYKLIDRKMDFNILSGLSTNFMIGNNLFLNEDSGKTKIGQMESVNTINYAGDLGLGLEYDINSKLKILFEPQFKYYLNSINKDNLVANRPYSMGFYTGLSYIF